MAELAALPPQSLQAIADVLKVLVGADFPKLIAILIFTVIIMVALGIISIFKLSRNTKVTKESNSVNEATQSALAAHSDSLKEANGRLEKSINDLTLENEKTRALINIVDSKVHAYATTTHQLLSNIPRIQDRLEILAGEASELKAKSKDIESQTADNTKDIKACVYILKKKFGGGN